MESRFHPFRYSDEYLLSILTLDIVGNEIADSLLDVQASVQAIVHSYWK